MPTTVPAESKGSESSTLLGKEYLENLAGLVQTAQDTIESINICMMTQILENADQLRETIKTNGKDGVNQLVENMLKAPIRKQSGRLRSVNVGLKEVLQKLQAAASQVREDHSDAEEASSSDVQR